MKKTRDDPKKPLPSIQIKLLMILAIPVCLVFVGLQTQSVITNRPPQQWWSIEIFRLVEEIDKEKNSPKERRQKIVELLNRLQKHKLLKSKSVASSIYQAELKLPMLISHPSDGALSLDSTAVQDSRNTTVVKLVQLLSNQSKVVAKDLENIEEAVASQVPELGQLLSHKNSKVLSLGAYTLGIIGEPAASQAPKLRQLLSHKNDEVRLNAVFALGNIGEPAAKTAPHLRRLLENKNENGDIRFAAANALLRMGKAAESQAPHLRRLLKNKNENSDILFVVANALLRMGHSVESEISKQGQFASYKNREKEAVSEASEQGQFLSHNNEIIRLAAVYNLKSMGHSASSEIPKLIQRLLDENKTVRLLAVYTLKNMRYSVNSEIPKLIQFLSHKDRNVRWMAAYLLEGIKESVQLALKNDKKLVRSEIPKLGQILLDKDEEKIVRLAAAYTLWSMGETAISKEAPMLIQLLLDEEQDFRIVASSLLMNMGDAAASQAPTLIQLLSHKDRNVSLTAASVFLHMEQAAISVLRDRRQIVRSEMPKLGQLVLDKDQNISLVAIKALESTGKAAISETPELVEALNKALTPNLDESKAQALYVILEDLFKPILKMELKEVHGLELPQGSFLADLLNSEPERSKAFTQSMVLLTLSLLILGSLLFILIKTQSQDRLFSVDQLITLLPEEYVGELNALERRLKKAKVPSREIQLLLLQEIIPLLWFFYIKIKVDNLRLPSDDHKPEA